MKRFMLNVILGLHHIQHNAKCKLYYNVEMVVSQRGECLRKKGIKIVAVLQTTLSLT